MNFVTIEELRHLGDTNIFNTPNALVLLLVNPEVLELRMNYLLLARNIGWSSPLVSVGFIGAFYLPAGFHFW